MALIKCNECGHMISEKAKSCPKCGAKNVKISNGTSKKDETSINKQYSILMLVLKSILVLLYAFVVALMMLGSKPEMAPPHNLYSHSIPAFAFTLILAILFGLLGCRSIIKPKKIRKYCIWIVVGIPIAVIAAKVIEVKYLNETAIKYNTIEHLTENIDGTVWINEKGGIKMSFEKGFVHVQTKQSGDNWNPAQTFEYEIMESEGVEDVRKLNYLYLSSVKFPAIRWKNTSVDYKDMSRKATKPDGGNEVKEKDLNRDGYHYFIPLINKYYWFGSSKSDIMLFIHRMKFVKKSSVGAVSERDTEEIKQEVVKTDSTKISDVSEPIQQKKVTLTPNLISNVQQYEKLGTYSEGMALVQRNGKWGYINTMGNEVIPCQFEGEEYGGWGHNFSDGYAVVVIDGKHGYIDRSGNVVIAPIYEDAGDFSEGIACVSKMGHDKLVFINKEGKEIEYLSNRYVWDWNIDRKLPKFQNGICKVHVELPKDKQSEGDWVEIKWINSKGEQVSPPQAKEESEELDRFWVEENGISKVGYKNKQGDIVVRAKYTTIGGFSQGLAVATLQYGTSANDGEYFCIYGYVDMYNHDTFADEDFQRIENAYRNNPNP